MKIELKPNDFKLLYEVSQRVFTHKSGYDNRLVEIVQEVLKPQYEKAFNKYKYEKQEFEIGDWVEFKLPGYKDWIKGVVLSIQRLKNGQHKYTISYESQEYSDNNPIRTLRETNPLTKKNIRLVNNG